MVNVPNAASDGRSPASTSHFAAQQRLLVKLYTDESLRGRMRESPAELLKEHGLEPTEAAVWQTMLTEIELFAESLQIKRRAEARTLLPLTVAALGRVRFNDLFLAYAPTHLPTGHWKPHDDAVAFGAWLLRERSCSDLLTPWQLDVIRFEHICRQMMFRRFGFTVRRLNHAVHRWNPTAPSDEPPPLRRSLYVWWAWRGQVRWWWLL